MTTIAAIFLIVIAGGAAVLLIATVLGSQTSGFSSRLN
jgi:hypothetical protein